MHIYRRFVGVAGPCMGIVFVCSCKWYAHDSHDTMEPNYGRNAGQTVGMLKILLKRHAESKKCIYWWRPWSTFDDVTPESNGNGPKIPTNTHGRLCAESCWRCSLLCAHLKTIRRAVIFVSIRVPSTRYTISFFIFRIETMFTSHRETCGV